MSQVKITIGPKSYSIACGPGEEEKIAKLGAMVNDHYAKLGDSRAALEAQNMLFAALFMADELEDARSQTQSAKLELAEAKQQLEAEKADAANALREAEAKVEKQKEKSGGKKAELRAEIETLRKAEERARKDNAKLKADIAEMQERARHQHDMFGGPAEDAALSEAMAEQLEVLAAKAEAVANKLEQSDTKSTTLEEDENPS